jgi:hypothetical protein
LKPLAVSGEKTLFLGLLQIYTPRLESDAKPAALLRKNNARKERADSPVPFAIEKYEYRAARLMRHVELDAAQAAPLAAVTEQLNHSTQ